MPPVVKGNIFLQLWPILHLVLSLLRLSNLMCCTYVQTMQVTYTLVLEQITSSLEALREECRQKASANQTLIRSDLDQIMSSLCFLEEKVRGMIWKKHKGYKTLLEKIKLINEMWHHVFQRVYVKKQIRCVVSLLPPTFRRSLKCSQRTSVQASRRCSTHYAHRWMQVSHTQLEEQRRQRRWRRNLRRLHDHNCWNLSQTLCAWCQTEVFRQRQSKQCHFPQPKLDLLHDDTLKPITLTIPSWRVVIVVVCILQALSSLHTISLDQCYRQVENLTTKLEGLKQRFGLSSTQRLVHSAQLEMEKVVRHSWQIERSLKWGQICWF